MYVSVLGSIHIDPSMVLVGGSMSVSEVGVVRLGGRGLGIAAQRGPPQRLGGSVLGSHLGGGGRELGIAVRDCIRRRRRGDWCGSGIVGWSANSVAIQRALTFLFGDALSGPD